MKLKNLAILGTLSLSLASSAQAQTANPPSPGSYYAPQAGQAPTYCAPQPGQAPTGYYPLPAVGPTASAAPQGQAPMNAAPQAQAPANAAPAATPGYSAPPPGGVSLTSANEPVPAITANDDDNPIASFVNRAWTKQPPPGGPAGPAMPTRVDATKFPLVRLTGFFQLDDAMYDQSVASKAAIGDAQNGVGFRRARLAAAGNLTEFTGYYLEMDFATAGRPSFLDVWGEQKNLPFLGTVRVGQFRQPTTMDALTSIRHLDFLERNAAFQAMDPFRRVGIMAYDMSQDERTTWANSVYATGFTFFNPATTAPGGAVIGGDSYNTLGDTRFGTQIGDNGGVSYATRVTHLLYYDDPSQGRYLLHVGGGYNFSEMASNGGAPGGATGNTYQARSIPEQFVGDPTASGIAAAATPFVADTGRYAASSYHFGHLELAGNAGPAHFQTEYLVTSVNQIGGPAVFTDGAYFQTGYFLTGESCGYNKAGGVMDYNVKPFREFFGVGRGRNRTMCGWGAWEVVGRWSYLDLRRTGAAPAANPSIVAGGSGVNTGVLNEGTFGLNWWWNQYTRLQFNYIHTMMDSNIGRGSQMMDTYASRFQIEF
jgi:phosphate-selective porin OprO/OprP